MSYIIIIIAIIVFYYCGEDSGKHSSSMEEEKGINDENKSADVSAPLVSAHCGSMDFIVSFIQAGGPVSCADSNGDTLLHAAASGWQYRMVEYLIISGADPNVQNKNGETPLHVLTTQREVPGDGYFIDDENKIDARLKTYRTLFLRRADASIKNNNGVSPLHIAAYTGDLFALNQLAMAMHNNIDMLSSKGITALAGAIAKGQIDCVNHLLSLRADVSIRLPWGGNAWDMLNSSELPEMRALASKYKPERHTT